MTVTEIQKRLEDRRTSVVADRTGLSKPTIMKIKNHGASVNLTTKTVDILSAYFEAN